MASEEQHTDTAAALDLEQVPPDVHYSDDDDTLRRVLDRLTTV
jgi:hypothetical protein